MSRTRLLRRFGLPVVILVVLAGVVAIAPGALGVGDRPETSAVFGCDSPVPPGASTQTLVVGNAKRTYLLVVPSSLSPSPRKLGDGPVFDDSLASSLKPGTPVPVIMALHGGSDTAENARRYMGIPGDRPALYVYPQAPYWPEAGGVGWNVDPNGVDFPYFDALLADLSRRYCVDSARIFATGKSNGGFMVNALACFRPGMLRGIASVAGGGPQTSRCTTGVAAMIVHGTADQRVPIRSGQWSRDYWRVRNGDQGKAPASAAPLPCVSYPAAAKPVLWCQHGGGHIWPSWTGAGVLDFFLGVN